MVYAIVEAEQGGLFRSADGGESWERLTMLNPRPMYYSKIVLDPTDTNRVYLLGSNRGLFISDDGGRAFRDVFSGVHGEDHALWVDPANPARLIAGGDGGVAISFDRGLSWLFRINLPIGQFYNISANNNDPFVVCGGLQDNGSWCTPSATSLSYGISFKEAFNIGGGDGMYATFVDERTLIVSSQNGYATRLDLDTMQRQIVGPIAPLEPERARRAVSLVLDDPDRRLSLQSGHDLHGRTAGVPVGGPRGELEGDQSRPDRQRGPGPAAR